MAQHPTAAVPRKAGLSDVQVIYKGDSSAKQHSESAPSSLWESDVRTWIGFAISDVQANSSTPGII